jgi:putative MATE family efflux protein
MRKQVLMTEGNIYKKLLAFALPIFIGNLFQELYNTADTIIVGRFISSEALAAVGSTGAIINLMIGFFSGVATGAGVVVARHYGAGRQELLKKSIQTFVIFAIWAGILMAVIGFCGARSFLVWTRTPAECLDDASIYLHIYFLGAIFNMLYNAGAGILRAVGDSRRPLYFLMFTTVLNIALDIFFIAICKMGVAGAALATVCCQAVSAILVFVILLGTKGNYRLVLKGMKVDLDLLKDIVRLGLPAGLQAIIVSASNVLVQSNVNSFGTDVMAGYTSANKVDAFLDLMQQTAGLTITTYVGQNIGARKYRRVSDGIKAMNVIAIGAIGLVTVIIWIFAPQIAAFIDNDANVIPHAVLMMRLAQPFYIILAYNSINVGALRAAGYSNEPAVIVVLNYTVVRQIYLWFMNRFFRSEVMLFACYPITWVTCALCMFLYARHTHWMSSLEEKIDEEEKLEKVS